MFFQTWGGELANTVIDPDNTELPDLDDRASGPAGAAGPDYFVERDGVRFAGMHLLIDMWGAVNLDDEAVIREALRRATEACGATLLHLHAHRFHESGGISGVAVLAESHISIHTWPERGFAAIDIFMCGTCDPMDAIGVLETTFHPDDIRVNEQRRGLAG
jgi:S-adenosylmethionine decarboxylase